MSFIIKMNILYGVCGEGYGHSSRSKLIINFLLEKGHNVKVLSYGKAYNVLKEHFDVFKIYGPHISYYKNGIDYAKTAWKGLESSYKNLMKTPKITKMMAKFKPNLIISDMEPFSAIISFYYNLPLISLDNQHRITNCELKYPAKYKKDAFIAKATINLFVRNAKAYIITNFFNAKCLVKNSYVVDPILRKEILELKPKEKNFVLVYLHSSRFKSYIKILENVREKFIVYGSGKCGKKGNIIFKNDKKEFIKDLRDCKAIIANAGYTLISEALFLKKPYLATPLPNQFEQILNAYYVGKLGYGYFTEEIDEEKVVGFLHNIENYKKGIKNVRNDKNKKLFKVLSSLISKIEHE